MVNKRVKLCRAPPIEVLSMDGSQLNETGSSMVSITVLSVTPVRAGKLFAFASVEIDIDGSITNENGASLGRRPICWLSFIISAVPRRNGYIRESTGTIHQRRPTGSVRRQRHPARRQQYRRVGRRFGFGWPDRHRRQDDGR
jgi:hypothetical protein